MNGLEIKEKRKKLGLTQKKLAELVGVSTQTINGYENGKEIPATKHQILDSILNNSLSNILTNSDEPNIKISGYDRRILELQERINEHNEIIKLLKPKSEEAKHHIEVIRLLNIQIDIIKESKINHDKEL